MSGTLDGVIFPTNKDTTPPPTSLVLCRDKLCVDDWYVVPTHPRACSILGCTTPSLRFFIRLAHQAYRVRHHQAHRPPTNHRHQAPSSDRHQTPLGARRPFSLPLDPNLHPLSILLCNLLQAHIFLHITKSHQNKMATKYKRTTNKIKTL